MEYLLIDFGASFIKSVVFDLKSGEFKNKQIFKSPLYNKVSISKSTIISAINDILDLYPNIYDIFFCCIIGGGYINDIYHSWKSPIKEFDNTNNLISGSIGKHYKNKIIHNIFGDTHCVIESVSLEKNDVLINMGTGSQIIKLNPLGTFLTFGKSYDNISYIPSGRALNAYASFFEEMNINFYYELSKLTYEDLISSNLQFNLNIFKESLNYTEDGDIHNITEYNLTFKNFLSSILRSYIEQYFKLSNLYIAKKIYLSGGIPKKIEAIGKYFSEKLDAQIILNTTDIEDTHIGMAKIIKQIGEDEWKK